MKLTITVDPSFAGGSVKLESRYLRLDLRIGRRSIQAGTVSADKFTAGTIPIDAKSKDAFARAVLAVQDSAERRKRHDRHIGA